MILIIRILIGIVLAVLVTSAFIYTPCIYTPDMPQSNIQTYLILLCFFALISLPWNILIFLLICIFVPESVISQQDILFIYDSLPCWKGSTSWQAFIVVSWISIALGVFINTLIIYFLSNTIYMFIKKKSIE